MKDYWLAKLIGSVKKVDSRKQLQKSIYLLQQAGSPLQCRYILHYYGPYSFELASLIDQLDAVGIIKETREGPAYKSNITPKGKKVVGNFEKTGAGVKAKSAINSFIRKFVELNKQDPLQLELAATMVYFYEDDWDEAKRQTAIFKRINHSDAKLIGAADLAKGIVHAG